MVPGAGLERLQPGRDGWSQLSAWGQYAPGGDLDQLTTPILAIFGGNDPLVPVQASITRLRETADRTARPQQIAVLDDADHRLQVGSSLAPGYPTTSSRDAKRRTWMDPVWRLSATAWTCLRYASRLTDEASRTKR